MDITPLMRPDQKVIQSYSNGKFRINGEIIDQPVLVWGSQLLKWDQDGQSLAPLELIEPIKGDLDILLIGTGATHKILPPSQRAQWKSLGFTVDIMDTPSACRTFNVLTAEGRRVAAALIPVSL